MKKLIILLFLFSSQALPAEAPGDPKITEDSEIKSKVEKLDVSFTKITIDGNGPKLFEDLVQKQIEANKVDVVDTKGIPLLCEAVAWGNISLVKNLLKSKANANIQSQDGYNRTPLMFCKKVEVAELLIANGADVNAINSGGNTALDLFLNSRDKDLVNLLFKLEAKYKPISAMNYDTQLWDFSQIKQIALYSEKVHVDMINHKF